MKTPWQKTFDPNYLGSWSLDDGEELTATVTKSETVEMMNTQGQKHARIIIHLDTAPKNGLLLPMVIGNKENAKALEKISGSKFIEDWVGSRVTIFVKGGIKSFGEVVEALRIKPAVPAKKRKLNEEEFARMLTALAAGTLNLADVKARYQFTDAQLSQL